MSQPPRVRACITLAWRQEDVFSDLGMDVVSSAFEGYNCSVLAYGQTGAGKSFTMMGQEGVDLAGDSQRGLVPRIGEAVFRRIAEVRMHCSRCGA